MLWFSIAPWKDLYGDFGGGSWVVSVTRRAATIHPSSRGRRARRPGGGAHWIARQPAHRVQRCGHPRPVNWAEHCLATLWRSCRHRSSGSSSSRTACCTACLSRRSGRIRTRGASASASRSAWRPPRRCGCTCGDPGCAPVGAALVLADPEAVARKSRRRTCVSRRSPGRGGKRRAIAGLLDLDARHVLEGRAASERSLKNIPLGPFSVLHLAVHARADAAFPERSAVFLAAGDEGEDGWLQPREIAALDLRGRLVVLSACESADGALLAGEGPLSLARAFFAAGAGAVVATRWPLRDDDAAFVMERFYRALGAGDSVGGALRRARRDAIDEGHAGSVVGRRRASWRRPAHDRSSGGGNPPHPGPVPGSLPWHWPPPPSRRSGGPNHGSDDGVDHANRDQERIRPDGPLIRTETAFDRDRWARDQIAAVDLEPDSAVEVVPDLHLGLDGEGVRRLGADAGGSQPRVGRPPRPDRYEAS